MQSGINWRLPALALLLLAFSAAHLAGATSPQTYPFCTAADVSGYTAATINVPFVAEAMAAVALMVSFCVIGVAYIVNKMVPSTGINRWLQDEYKDVAKTAILIVVIFSVITMVSGISLALTGTTPGGSYSSNMATLLQQSELSLCNVNTYLLASFANIVQLSSEYGVLRSVTLSWGGIPIPLGYVTFESGWSGFQPFLNNFLQTDFNPGVDPSLFYSLLSDVYFPLINIFSLQMPLLPLLMTAGLTVLIPLGLILRAFPFVRGIGGTVLALGLLIAVVWPSLLVLFNNPISAYFYNAYNIGYSTTVAGCTSLNLGLIAPVCSALSGLGLLEQTVTGAVPPSGLTSSLANFPSVDSTAYGELTGAAATGIGQKGLFVIALSTDNSIYDALNYILSNTIFLVFEFFFVFIFDLVIAYTITDNIARMLGGSIKLDVGGKLKLV